MDIKFRVRAKLALNLCILKVRKIILKSILQEDVIEIYMIINNNIPQNQKGNFLIQNNWLNKVIFKLFEAFVHEPI